MWQHCCFHGINKKSFHAVGMVGKDCGRTSISQPGEGQREEDEEGGRWRKQ